MLCWHPDSYLGSIPSPFWKGTLGIHMYQGMFPTSVIYFGTLGTHTKKKQNHRERTLLHGPNGKLDCLQRAAELNSIPSSSSLVSSFHKQLENEKNSQVQLWQQKSLLKMMRSLQCKKPYQKEGTSLPGGLPLLLIHQHIFLFLKQSYPSTPQQNVFSSDGKGSLDSSRKSGEFLMPNLALHATLTEWTGVNWSLTLKTPVQRSTRAVLCQEGGDRRDGKAAMSCPMCGHSTTSHTASSQSSVHSVTAAAPAMRALIKQRQAEGKLHKTFNISLRPGYEQINYSIISKTLFIWVKAILYMCSVEWEAPKNRLISG